jgi:acyl carrier protein
MTESEALALIEEVVRQETGSINFKLDSQMTADDVPGWDSLAHGRIVLALEMSLGRSIDIDATYEAATMGDLAALVRATVL